jgi:hypothetical protein
VSVASASSVMSTVQSTQGAIGFIDLPSWTSTSGVPYTSLRNQVPLFSRPYLLPDGLGLYNSFSSSRLTPMHRTSKPCCRRSRTFSV